MEIRLLLHKKEMLEQLEIVQQLYPDFTIEKYGKLLDEMLESNYSQIIIIKNLKKLTGVYLTVLGTAILVCVWGKLQNGFMNLITATLYIMPDGLNIT